MEIVTVVIWLCAIWVRLGSILDVLKDIRDKQTNVAEVVRCKDCKHFTAGYCCRDIKGISQMHYMGEEAFCSYGERKEKT